LGNNYLNEFIETCENICKKAIIKQLDEQQGYEPITFANINKANKYFSYKPKISLKRGFHNTYVRLLLNLIYYLFNK
jgi:nucleoside-diphosphate-sugar epimerase